MDKNFVPEPALVSIAGQTFPVLMDARIPPSGFFTDLLCRQLKIDPATSLLDIGCGSGVIGIFALRMGARYVAFNDIQEAALEVTRCNLELNQVPLQACHFYNMPFVSLQLTDLAPEITLITFNAPTMPQELLDMSTLTPPERFFRDGGPDGLRVIRGFLDWYINQKIHPDCLITVCSLAGKKRLTHVITQYDDRLLIHPVAQSYALTRTEVIPGIMKLSPAQQKDRGLILMDGKWHEELYIWNISACA